MKKKKNRKSNWLFQFETWENGTFWKRILDHPFEFINILATGRLETQADHLGPQFSLNAKLLENYVHFCAKFTKAFGALPSMPNPAAQKMKASNTHGKKYRHVQDL